MNFEGIWWRSEEERKVVSFLYDIEDWRRHEYYLGGIRNNKGGEK